MPGQRRETGRTVRIAAPTLAVRGRERLRPWPVWPRKPRHTTHSGRRQPRNPASNGVCAGQRRSTRPGATGCETVGSVTAELVRADVGSALLAMLRTVAGQGIWAPGPWTGSWTGAPDSPSVVSAVSAMTRAISAGSASVVRGRTSRNPPVVGSSPTRPTPSIPSTKRL
jgi:hypothetical protein